MEIQLVAEGLKFPEGPIAMQDGSVILTEIQGQRLTRITPDGRTSLVAETGGGPNGAAIGPDGAIYVTNNGGSFHWLEQQGLTIPGPTPPEHVGGSIQRVDIATGKVETLYDSCDGRRLVGPNDLVFDNHGGFYFTDLGKVFGRNLALGGLYYAKADGSSIRQLAFPIQLANGCGLSPDGKTIYVAQTYTGWLVKWTVTAPGEIAPSASGIPGDLVGAADGRNLFDSLAVEADGRVCVATIGSAPSGGISVIEPNGNLEFLPFEDPAVTNICFGGKDMKSAWLTLSGHGRLIMAEWPRPGLKLVHQEI